MSIKPKLKLKILPNETLQKNKISFKETIFQRIITLIDGDYTTNTNQCILWLGYKQKHKKYDKACHIVYMKEGRKHFIDQQKYIYNYINSPNATYSELIRMKNTIRNIDECKNRGVCCSLGHLEQLH